MPVSSVTSDLESLTITAVGSYPVPVERLWAAWADPRQLEAAVSLGAPVVELHTGRYCEIEGEAQKAELVRIQKAAAFCEKLGLECHAGHGLNYENVAAIAAIPNVRELNIGHFLIGDAIFVGLKDAIGEMRRLMDAARTAGHTA